MASGEELRVIEKREGTKDLYIMSRMGNPVGY